MPPAASPLLGEFSPHVKGENWNDGFSFLLSQRSASWAELSGRALAQEIELV